MRNETWDTRGRWVEDESMVWWGLEDDKKNVKRNGKKRTYCSFSLITGMVK